MANLGFEGGRSENADPAIWEASYDGGEDLDWDDYGYDNVAPQGYLKENGAFCLEQFSAEPAMWLEDSGVECFQTMGSVTLAYHLADAEQCLTQEDLFVEVSSWQLEVFYGGSSKATRKDISALCGEFSNTVRRGLTSWRLQDDSGEKVLYVFLSKQEHRAWKSLWYAGVGMQNSNRKTKFAWNRATNQVGGRNIENERKLIRVSHDEPAENLQQESQFDPMRLCVCLNDVEQSGGVVVIYIHFDAAELQRLEEVTPFEEIIGADVEEKRVSVYFRGAQQFLVFEAELEMRCAPEQTVWQLVRARKGDPGINKGDAYNPALQIVLTKHPDEQSLTKQPLAWYRHADELAFAEERAREKAYKLCEEKLRKRQAELLDPVAAAKVPATSATPTVITRSVQSSRQAAQMEYLVDNSILRAATKGLGYRLSQSLQDKDGAELAEWGTLVLGTDQGNGWVKVEHRYLPIELNGKKVLTGGVIGPPGRH